MPNSPAWLNDALKAAEDAIRQVPLALSGSTRETKNGLRNADEVVWEALHAFMAHVPEAENLYRDRRDMEDALTLHHLKSTFTEQSDA
jgi:hypothetical protein